MRDLMQNLQILQSANRRFPRMVWYCAWEAILDTAHVYLPIWILAWVLQAVAAGSSQQFIASAILYMAVRAITDWLVRAVQESRIAYGRCCNEASINELYKKINHLPYEIYQDSKVRQQYNIALENMYYEFDYSDMIQEEATIFSNGCKTVAALCMVVALLAMPPINNAGWELLADPIVCGAMFAAMTALLIGVNQYRLKHKEPERVQLLKKHGMTESRLLYLQNSIVCAFPQYLSYRLFGMKPMLVQRMEQNSNENVAFYQKLRHIARYISNGYALSSALSTLFSFWLVIIKILSGALPVTLLLTFVQGLLQLHDAMLAVAAAYGRIRLAAPYFRSIEAVMLLPDTESASVNPVLPPHMIQFQHVCYRYPGTTRDAVHEVNLELTANQWHVLVGENGSGKTTLLLLLMRYLTPSSGCILFDGKDIQAMDLAAYRRLFASCFQAGGIYPVPLGENVSFTKNGNFEKVRTSMKAAGTQQEFLNLEQLKKSMKGRSLSGGETQKVLSARAFYKSASIYIFDEPAAALDPISEDHLYRQIITLAEDAHVLFVSHRLSVCKECKDILVMKDGTLCERGSHASLLQANGEYASLWNAQASTYRQV